MLLNFEKTKELLEKYQIPMVESLVIKNLGQGIDFANKVGFPVVLKLISSDVLHKIDKGLVKLNIQNAQDLEITWKELGYFGGQSNRVPSDGEIVIQKQISGLELFVGMKRDKSFGPVISFGLGGVFVEVLEDIVFGICPVDKTQALEMIKKIRGYKILQGYRGQSKIDIEKLANILASISKLAVENENIQEIDFNPIIANENNILVVDGKII
ncbi:MAG: acetate--CoA ligase family protein [bacterium]|nr:acetate--CoA ligase family protein [bacterium]